MARDDDKPTPGGVAKGLLFLAVYFGVIPAGGLVAWGTYTLIDGGGLGGMLAPFAIGFAVNAGAWTLLGGVAGVIRYMIRDVHRSIDEGLGPLGLNEAIARGSHHWGTWRGHEVHLAWDPGGRYQRSTLHAVVETDVGARCFFGTKSRLAAMADKLAGIEPVELPPPLDEHRVYGDDAMWVRSLFASCEATLVALLDYETHPKGDNAIVELYPGAWLLRRQGVYAWALEPDGVRKLLDDLVDLAEAAEAAPRPANNRSRDPVVDCYLATFDHYVGAGRQKVGFVVLAVLAIALPLAGWLPVLLMR